MKYAVKFHPLHKSGRIEEGKTLLEAARELGVALRSECGGKGICGKCQVVVEAGNKGLPPATKAERGILGDKLEAKYRLACRTPVSGPIQVLVPQESLAEEAVILTDGEGAPFNLEPAVEQYHLKLAAPSLSHPLADAERVLQSLERIYALKDVSIPGAVLSSLPARLRQAGWDVTVTIWQGRHRELIDVQPGYVAGTYGIAVDIGTTTLVVYLVNLVSGDVVATESMVNPQAAYGADVITRMAHAVKEAEGKEQLRQAVVSGLNQLIRQACARAGVEAKHVAEMTIVGNTVMHHLFLGLETRFLGRAPFTPVVHGPCDLKAGDLGLVINPLGNVHLLPNVAGFWGSDAVSDLIATNCYRDRQATLLIDIGTNGEVVLGSESLGLTACSVAAGPAFEGGHIQFGMNASRGAIEHLRVDSATYDVHYETIGGIPPKGICGSGILDAVAEMLRVGIVLPSGRMDTSIQCQRLRQGAEWPEFVLVWAENTALEEDIVLTQKDIREVQMGKAAFRVGAQILMQQKGVKQVEKVVLAGAFGSYLNPKSAVAIGMVPLDNPEKVISVGNAAGRGACLVLLSKSKRAEAANMAGRVNYLELTLQPDFNTAFVNEIAFPKKDS